MKRVAAAYFLSFLFLLVALVVALWVNVEPDVLPSAPGRPLTQRLVEGLHDPIGQVLMQLVLIVLAARLVGALFHRFGQPAVVGEMLAGIALGPSVIGAILPGFMDFVFPKSSFGNLSTLSQMGILLFMFGVGMELDTRLLKDTARSAILVSHMSIAIPFGLGLLGALVLVDPYRGTNTTFLAFSLFIGISMSITAFPVLARILEERRLVGTPLGSIVIASAAIDDVTAWSALAIIVAVAKAHSPFRALWTLSLAVLFIVIAMCGVRPLLARLISGPIQGRQRTATVMVASIVTAFLFALTTQAIGLHSFFGAFVAGVVIPRNAELRKFLHDRLYYLSALVLVPVFFAFTGLRMEIGALRTVSDWAACGLIFLIAIVGKFGGGLIASRVVGMTWRDSAAVGIMMNTRGLVELIALNLGLDLGVLSPKLFTMLVIMAFATTFMTGPILTALGLGLKESDGDDPATAARLTPA